MKRTYIILLLLFGLMQSFAQRNVVLIIADDLGKEYCDIYPDHAPLTVKLPNVKRLLERGIVFSNAWSNPVCSPTRAGILTGRYSFRTGVGDVVGGTNPQLSLTENTIPKVLNIFSPNGIAKACIGKWHLTTSSPAGYSYPNTLGFDHYEGNLAGGLGTSITGYSNWAKITNGVSSTSTTYATTEVVNNSIAYISNLATSNPTKPFYLQMAFNAPHTPYHLPPNNLLQNNTLSGTATDVAANPKAYFQAMTEAMDTEIGRFFDYLISSGKWDNTDIIFIGDNGTENSVAQVSPSKGTIYQGGISVPFIISGPDVVNPNRTSNAVVNTTDLFATILELFGNMAWQSQIPTTTVDSKSLLPIILDNVTTIKPWAFTEIFKTTVNANDGKTIRNDNYKLIKFTNGNERFFNLTTNPNESNNLLTGSMSETDNTNYNYLCSEMATLVGIGITCTTLDTNSFLTNSNEIYVIENPFNSKIILNKVEDEDEFSVYSISGKEFYRGKDISSKDFSYLTKGVYFVKIVNQNKVFKIIKN